LKSESFRAHEAGFAPSAGRHYLDAMTDRPKRPRDANQLAKFIVDVATEGESSVPLPDHEAQRAGGLKGGKARADKLSSEERANIAQKAARARWGN
jgi:hypothetical protein